jgi:hypothetical protein
LAGCRRVAEKGNDFFQPRDRFEDVIEANRRPATFQFLETYIILEKYFQRTEGNKKKKKNEDYLLEEFEG